MPFTPSRLPSCQFRPARRRGWRGTTLALLSTLAACSTVGDDPAGVSASTLSGGVVYAINSGGGALVDSTGVSYQADEFFAGGQAAAHPGAVAGTNDGALYETERYGCRR